MEHLTKHDCMIILKAIYQMANVDSTFDKKEKSFFKKIMEKMDVQQDELKQFMNQKKESILILGEQLSSKKAKRTFLLTLASMALVDDHFEEKEEELLKSLSDKLDVGNVKIDNMDFKEAESFVLNMFSKHKETNVPASPKKEFQVEQYNDLDIMMH